MTFNQIENWLLNFQQRNKNLYKCCYHRSTGSQKNDMVQAMITEIFQMQQLVIQKGNKLRFGTNLAAILKHSQKSIQTNKGKSQLMFNLHR